VALADAHRRGTTIRTPSARQAAERAPAAFTGSVANIETARRFLARKPMLTPLQEKQIEAVLFKAADEPADAPELVKQRIARRGGADGEALRVQRSSSTARKSRQRHRQRPAHASSTCGAAARSGRARRRSAGCSARSRRAAPSAQRGRAEAGLSRLLLLHGQRVRHDHRGDGRHGGADQPRAAALVHRAAHVGAPSNSPSATASRCPTRSPPTGCPTAGARIGPRWSTCRASTSTRRLAEKGRRVAPAASRALLHEPRFRVAAASPSGTKSSLYPVAPDAGFKKNTHASAWHIDLDRDVRSLMSVEAECRVVRDDAPRTRPHLLLPLLHQPRRAAAPARRREPRVPRGGGLA
jgi:peptidyl-dipeptidase A